MTRLSGALRALDEWTDNSPPPSTVKTNQRRRIAIHEAGHVVVSRKLGLSVTCVSVFPRAVCRTKGQADGWRDFCVALSGVAAELHVNPDLDLRDSAFETDFGNVWMAACEWFGVDPDCQVGDLSDEQHAAADKATKFVKDLVAKNWGSIERIAAKLMTVDKLDAAEIERLMLPQGGG